MKQHPILFSTPMVQAILAGNKTMTRRIVKPQPIFKEGVGKWYGKNEQFVGDKMVVLDLMELSCPYGKSGDVLWVRECFTVLEPEHCEGMSQRFYYKAEHHVGNEEWRLEEIEKGYPYQWKPSIHMPKSACRVWLEITNIRVERLQSISEKDAIAEGILPLLMSSVQLATSGQLYFDYSKPKQFFNEGLPPFWSFNSLWCSINGPDSWDENPWVWVIEFKRIEKPQP
jgi:hypothetical protein